MDDFTWVDKMVDNYNAWYREMRINNKLNSETKPKFVRYSRSAEDIERIKDMGMNAHLQNLADKIELDLRAESQRGLSTPYSSMFRSIAMAPSLDEKLTPKKIIRSGPMTIIFWKDGTKTKVRRTEGAEDDPYLAFCAGLAKKIYGNNSKVKKLIEEKTVEPKERKKKDED